MQFVFFIDIISSNRDVLDVECVLFLLLLEPLLLLLLRVHHVAPLVLEADGGARVAERERLQDLLPVADAEGLDAIAEVLNLVLGPWDIVAAGGRNRRQ